MALSLSLDPFLPNKMSLLRSIRMIFPEWKEDNVLPAGLSHVETSGNSTIASYTWSGGNIRRARLCELNVPGKFTAETIVIYPDSSTMTPIFGTEYISIANKKFFGAIDFHPLAQDESYLKTYIDEYLYDFPARSVEDSKFYDLSTHFSSKFWIKKSEVDFREEYIDWVDRYMSRYRAALEGGESWFDSRQAHINYDRHMAEKDPAHGILKSYFSAEFADFYVQKFLFDESA